jgi:hypothetical protein
MVFFRSLSRVLHVQELFSKLRFSYVEQVTKEKFLRAITSETPLFIEPHENVQLEEMLADEKLALKGQKEEVAELTEKLESMGRILASRESTQLFVGSMSSDRMTRL